MNLLEWNTSHRLGSLHTQARLRFQTKKNCSHMVIGHCRELFSSVLSVKPAGVQTVSVSLKTCNESFFNGSTKLPQCPNPVLEPGLSRRYGVTVSGKWRVSRIHSDLPSHQPALLDTFNCTVPLGPCSCTHWTVAGATLTNIYHKKKHRAAKRETRHINRNSMVLSSSGLSSQGL